MKIPNRNDFLPKTFRMKINSENLNAVIDQNSFKNTYIIKAIKELVEKYLEPAMEKKNR